MRFMFLFLGFLFASSAYAEPPSSFSKAKKLLKVMYADHQKTFYCGCDYEKKGKKLVPEPESCGFSYRKNQKRSQRIEWEHVMPAWAFGHQLQCWQEGGRKNCKKNPQFKKMEADLHNLVPAIGEVNGDRSNFSFSMLEGEPRVYGECDMEVNFKARKVEPSENVRGDIARTYFYMRDQYGVKISSKQEKLFNAWSKLDPVDRWELKRNELIFQIQGNRNAYVTVTGEIKVVEANPGFVERVKSALRLN